MQENMDPTLLDSIRLLIQNRNNKLKLCGCDVLRLSIPYYRKVEVEVVLCMAFTKLYGIEVIPAYENKITLFHIEYPKLKLEWMKEEIVLPENSNGAAKI